MENLQRQENLSYRFGAFSQNKRARHALVCDVPVPMLSFKTTKTPAIMTSPYFTFEAEHITMQDHENVDKNDFSFDHHQIIEGLEISVSDPTVVAPLLINR